MFDWTNKVVWFNWLKERPALWGMLLTVVVASAVYHGWFSAGIIMAGDWIPTPDAQMRDYWPFLPAWGMSLVLGVPMNVFGSILTSQYSIYGLLAHLGFGYGLAERLVFYFPAVIVGSAGGFLYTYSLCRRTLAGLIAGLFIVCNTYVVLIDGGGQLTVGVAFSFIPLVLWAFRGALVTGRLSYCFGTGLAIALQASYDVRLTYVTVGALLLYLPFLLLHLLSQISLTRALVRIIKLGTTSLTVAVAVHAPSVLQLLFVHGATSVIAGPPTGYTDISQAIGLSFMTMSNALSLLHPFWPQNPFGHLAPFQPALFLIPFLIFSLLLLRKVSFDLQYLVVLSLVSMFFVKGIHDPGGNIYLWLFQNFPGFDWFRDPSKFYQPLMFGMAALFGLSVARFGDLIKQHPKGKYWRSTVTLVWSGAWLALTIYPAYPTIINPHSGTVTPYTVPLDYQRLNAFIEKQPDYFRTLWFPQISIFFDYSSLHPSLGDGQGVASMLFGPPQLPNEYGYSWLSLHNAERILQALSVKYVIMPSASVSGGNYGSPYQPGNGQMSFPVARGMIRRMLPHFKELEIGSIHLFENPSYYPLIYVPTTVHAKQLSVPLSHYVLPQSMLQNSSAYASPIAAEVSTGSQSAVAEFSAAISPSQLPTVQLRQIAAGRIIVDVTNVTHAYIAFLLQTYNTNWRVYKVPKGANPALLSLLRGQFPLASIKHEIGEGYANAWKIDEQGSYTLIFLYWPQILEDVGSIISWSAIILCIIYMLGTSLQRRQRAPLEVVQSLDRSERPGRLLVEV